MSELGYLVKLLKAAGETTRLRLLALLAVGELSVKDMTEILQQSQPRISRHLKLLADAGLVERHAEGAWAYFALAEEGVAGDLVQRLLADLDINEPEIKADFARLQQVRQQQGAQAAAYFAQVAERWDILRGLHVPEAAVEAAVQHHLGAEKVGLMLDLGTGTGRMLELLADRYARGVGIDSSREMIAVARAKLAKAGIAHAHIRLGDIVDLGEYAGQADRIIIHQVLHYFDDPGVMLRAAHTALKPGGEILIVDFAPHDLEFLRTEHAHRRLGLSQGQMESWARGAGLDVVGFEDFPNVENADGLTACLFVLKGLGEKGDGVIQ